MSTLLLLLGAFIVTVDILFIVALCRVAKRADRKLEQQDPRHLGNENPSWQAPYADRSVVQGSEHVVRP